MFIFTVLAQGQRAFGSSLLITHPANLANNSLLALGVTTARPIGLSLPDETAFYAQQAMEIPIADHIHYIIVRPEHGSSLCLFQACYQCEESLHSQRQLLLPLLNRTRSLVLFASPDPRLVLSFLHPLFSLFQEASVPAGQIACTIVAPPENSSGTIDQGQYIDGLVRRPISPDSFSVSFGFEKRAAPRYADICPDFSWQVQEKFRSATWISSSKGSLHPANHTKPLQILLTEPWDQYVRLAPRQLVAFARCGAQDMLVDIQTNYTRQMLVLTILQQVALGGFEPADRVAAISIWNRIDRVIGTDWLVPLLQDANPDVRNAAVEAISRRLPNSIEPLMEMALLDFASDVYGTAQQVVVRALGAGLLKRLIDALDDPLFPKRQGARRMLSKVGMNCLPMLRTRIKRDPYAGRVGAAAVLAGIGNRRAQMFLKREFTRTKRSSYKRGLLNEAISSWSPDEWSALTATEASHAHQGRTTPGAGGGPFGIGRFVTAVVQVASRAS